MAGSWAFLSHWTYAQNLGGRSLACGWDSRCASVILCYRPNGIFTAIWDVEEVVRLTT